MDDHPDNHHLCATLGKSPVDSMKTLSRCLPLACVQVQQTFFRQKKVKQRRFDFRSGWTGIINAGSVDSMRDMIEEDSSLRTRELSGRIIVGKTTIDVILKKRLKMN